MSRAALVTRWLGSRGWVLLGPTEHRLATLLDELTRYGRVTLRSSELVDRTRLSRSELYRITARLRALGLFGIENDRGGTKGGRRYWRTRRGRAGGLDPARHRLAWARVAGYLRRFGLASLGRRKGGSSRCSSSTVPLGPSGRAETVLARGPRRGASPGFGNLGDAIRALAPELAAAWRLRP